MITIDNIFKTNPDPDLPEGNPENHKYEYNRNDLEEFGDAWFNMKEGDSLGVYLSNGNEYQVARKEGQPDVWYADKMEWLPANPDYPDDPEEDLRVIENGPFNTLTEALDGIITIENAESSYGSKN